MIKISFCKKCGLVRECYHYNGRTFLTCINCNRERERTRNKENPRAKWASFLKVNYGWSLEKYDQTLAVQKGRCAVCLVPMKKPHLDHNHATGHARGFLCARCNYLLGLAHDNKELLQKAINYLRLYDNSNPPHLEKLVHLAIGRKRSDASSPFMGVCWSEAEKKWEASVRVGGKTKHLGKHLRETCAARAVDAALIQAHGTACKLNFPGKSWN